MSVKRRLEKLEGRIEKEVQTSGPSAAHKLLASRIRRVLEHTEPGDPIRQRILDRFKELRDWDERNT